LAEFPAPRKLIAELNESYWLIYETAQKYCYELDINNNKKEF
jgi:hypothetical protein